MSKCTPNFKFELIDVVTKNVLQSFPVRQQNVECDVCVELSISSATLYHGHTPPYIEVIGTMGMQAFHEQYIILPELASDINSSRSYKIKLCKKECECVEEVVHDPQKYLIYKKCKDPDIYYYVDDPITNVEPSTIALILLDELRKSDIVDWLQNQTGPYGAGNSYGPAQFTPNALSVLISDGYYNEVAGFSGDLTNQTQLTALFNHIVDPKNSAKMIFAYLRKTIDYWALGTIATNGKFSNDESKVAPVGFDISEMPSVLGTLYSAGWQNLAGAGNGVHNAPGASPRWEEAFSSDNLGTVFNILHHEEFGNSLDPDSLTSAKRHIYDVRDDIKSVAGHRSEYVNVSTIDNVVIGAKLIKEETAGIDRNSDDYFIDANGYNSKYVDVDVSDATRYMSEFKCHSNSN